MSKKSFATRPSLLSVSIAAALGSTAPFLSAQAQPAPSEPRDEIIVTGSRIVQRDFEANSPIQTVDSELFENSSTLAVETVLNQLPQFVPAITQFDTGNVQPDRKSTRLNSSHRQ